MFHVGQRVVCVFDGYDPIACIYPASMIRKGEIVTVSKLLTAPNGKAGILVYERNLKPPWLGFYAHHFRPIDESRIDIFREMLTKVPSELEPA